MIFLAVPLAFLLAKQRQCIGEVRVFDRVLTKPVILIVLLAGIFCLGALRLQWAAWQYETLPHYLAGAEVCVEGTVAEKGYSYDGDKGAMTRYVLSMDCYAYTDEKVFHGGAGKLYITIPSSCSLPIHSTVSYKGTVKNLAYYRNEGMYDAFHRDREKGIFLKSYNDKVDCIHILAEPSGWQHFLERLRNSMTYTFLAVLNREEAHILSSLLFGGHYDELPVSLLESFSITGLIHILSVSGSHVALVLAAVQVVGRAVRLREKGLFLLSAICVLFYGALSDFTAPVIRASVMGLICAYSLIARRDYTAIHALALAIIAMLMYSPYLSYDISFQLSCGASAGIVLLQRRVSSWLQFLPKFLCDGFAVCICAQIFLVPLLFANFHAFPVYSLIANITVGPLLDVSIILGLAAVLVSWIFLPVSQLLLWIVHPLLVLAVKGNYFLAGLPHSRLWSGALSFPMICAWYLVVGAVFFLPRQRRPLLATAILACVCSMAWGWYYKDEAVIRIFDMGADKATCAVYSDNSAYLWYNKSQWSNPEQVACVLTPALRHAGIFHLQGCTVSGHNVQRTANQISAQFTIGRACRAASDNEMVFDGNIPYHIYMMNMPKQFPVGACLEIHDFKNLEKTAFPNHAAAVIIHGNTQQKDIYKDWLEWADFYEVPCFSPSRDGEIICAYRQGMWTFITYGGDIV